MQGAKKNEEAARELAQVLSEECRSVEDVHRMLKELFKGTLETMLEAEMDEHLGYEKHDNRGDLGACLASRFHRLFGVFSALLHPYPFGVARLRSHSCSLLDIKSAQKSNEIEILNRL